MRRVEARTAVRDFHADNSAARSERPAGAKIRAGIVGAGLMARWHAHALEKAGGAVVGIVDQDLGRAKNLAGSYRRAGSYVDLQEMMTAERPDVVHICTPTGTHEQIAATVINARRHLMVEKPLVATAAATEKLYERAEAGGVLICPVHQFVFQDGVEKAKKQLSQIGRLIHFESVIQSAGAVGSEAGGAYMIASGIMPHPLSLAQAFLPGAIADAAWNVLHPEPGELLIFARAAAGATISFRISMNSRPTRNSLSLVGTNGTINLDLFHGFVVFDRGGKATRASKILRPFEAGARNLSAATVNLIRRSIRRESAYPGLRSLIGSFYGAITGGGPPPFTSREVIEIAKARDLIMQQAQIVEGGS